MSFCANFPHKMHVTRCPSRLDHVASQFAFEIDHFKATGQRAAVFVFLVFVCVCRFSKKMKRVIKIRTHECFLFGHSTDVYKKKNYEIQSKKHPFNCLALCDNCLWMVNHMQTNNCNCRQRMIKNWCVISGIISGK